MPARSTLQKVFFSFILPYECILSTAQKPPKHTCRLCLTFSRWHHTKVPGLVWRAIRLVAILVY